MATEKKNSGLGLPQTKGSYQVRGIVFGTSSKNFYTEKMTKSDKPWRNINFGLKVFDDENVYISLSGGEQEKVYFSKTITEDNKKKTDVQEVAWKDRFKFNKENYKLIGVNVGLTKKVNEKGKEVNDKKMFVPYDACKDISDNLKDDQSVFVKGNIEYSHFEGKDGVVRAVKFVPTQISLCSDDINFSDEKFKKMSDFTQVIIFTGIRPENDNKTRFVVDAKIVNFNTVEDAEFFIEKKDLANTFRNKLKPYTALKVWGSIKIIKDTEEVESKDCWGEENNMEKVNTPTKRELIICGADPSSIDAETYSETIIEQAIAKINANKKAENEYGAKQDDWGDFNSSNNSDDEEAW